MSRKAVAFTLNADVANAGTFTVGYPTPQVISQLSISRGLFSLGITPKISMIDGGLSLVSPTDFTISYGALLATITYNGSTTLKAGWRGVLELDIPGINDWLEPVIYEDALPMRLIRMNLGAPIVSADNTLRASAALATTGAFTLITAGLQLDVPRNIIITSSGNDSGVVFTITGLDRYGAAMSEAITGANAGVAAGVKAFSKVLTASNNVAAAGTVKVGFGNVLGLPIYLPNASAILKELQDGAAATTGTTVAGLSPNTKSTTTTADVRGTYVPNATPDGSKAFQLVCALSDFTHKGNPQA